MGPSIFLKPPPKLKDTKNTFDIEIKSVEAIEIWAWYTRQVHLVGQRPSIPGGEPWEKCNFVHPVLTRFIQPRCRRALVWHLVECRRIFQLRVLPQLVCYPFGVASFQKITFWLFLFPNTYSLIGSFSKNNMSNIQQLPFIKVGTSLLDCHRLFKFGRIFGCLSQLTNVAETEVERKTCASRESGGSHLTSGPSAASATGW